MLTSGPVAVCVTEVVCSEKKLLGGGASFIIYSTACCAKLVYCFSKFPEVTACRFGLT